MLPAARKHQWETKVDPIKRLRWVRCKACGSYKARGAKRLDACPGRKPLITDLQPAVVNRGFV